MTVRAFWVDHDCKAIQMILTGQWQWHELVQASEKTAAMLDQVDYPVAIIVNLHQKNWMPANFTSHLKALVNRSHPNTGLIIVVNNNPLFHTMFEMFQHQVGTVSFRYRFVGSVDEAYRLLNINPDL